MKTPVLFAVNECTSTTIKGQINMRNKNQGMKNEEEIYLASISNRRCDCGVIQFISFGV